jgi:hypothetical protein
MDHMFVVPAEVVAHWRKMARVHDASKPIENAMVRAASDLRDSISDIASDPYQAKAAVADRLAKFREFKRQQGEVKTETPVPEPVARQFDVTEGIPGSYRSKANRLLRSLEQRGFAYDKDDGTVSLAGRPVPGVSVSEVLRSSVSKTRRIRPEVRRVVDSLSDKLTVRDRRLISNPHLRREELEEEEEEAAFSLPGWIAV